jgi:hypothetical protein
MSHCSLETQRTFCSEAQDVHITSYLQIYVNFYVEINNLI